MDIRSHMRGVVRELGFRVRYMATLRGVERRNPILVYQMGKVGSSTVAATLAQLGLDLPVLHVHTLSAKGLSHAIKRQRSSLTPYLHEHLIASSSLRKKLGKGVFPCKIITLTREPVSRAISFVFEANKIQVPEAFKSGNKLDVDAARAKIEYLLQNEGGTSDPSQWFDNELKEVFGIDVFDHPYDLERGYTIIEKGSVSVLVMRMEDMNESLPAALGEFLQLDPAEIKLARENTSEEKWYVSQMRNVTHTLHLSHETVGAITSSRYFRHFYQGEEERLRKRWCLDGDLGKVQSIQ